MERVNHREYLANFLNDWIDYYNLSQSKLSKITGVHRDVIKEMREQTSKRLSFDMIERISAAINIPVIVMLTYDRDKNYPFFENE